MLPIDQVIVIMLKGTGDCAVVDWRFLHLSLAAWSAILFALLVLTMIYTLYKARMQK
jgi:disulfide bond formation protein DsbB